MARLPPPSHTPLSTCAGKREEGRAKKRLCHGLLRVLQTLAWPCLQTLGVRLPCLGLGPHSTNSSHSLPCCFGASRSVPAGPRLYSDAWPPLPSPHVGHRGTRGPSPRSAVPTPELQNTDRSCSYLAEGLAQLCSRRPYLKKWAEQWRPGMF